MAIMNPPLYMEYGQYTAQDDRLLLDTLVPNHGIATGFVVQQTPTASMAVRITAGRAFVKSSGANNGAYHVVNDSSIDLEVDSSHATYARIDKVILRVRDSAIIGGTDNDAIVEVLTGTPASSPATPSTPANSIVLATISIPAKSATVITSRIKIVNTSDNARISYSLAPQAILCTSTTRPTQDLTDGMIIFETNTGITRIRSGGTWKYVTGDINANGVEANIISANRGGWRIDSGQALVRGGTVLVYVNFTRTGTAISVPANGNIGNQEICTIAANYRPVIPAPASTIASGRSAGGYVNTAGTLFLANLAPGSNIATNESFSLGYTAALSNALYSV